MRGNLFPILILAVPGVILTTVVVGLIVAAGVHLPLRVAFVFGALISATDPVSVVALFRALGAPRRLTVLVEGESLFNDGAAIVIFNMLLAAALSTTPAETAGAATFNLLSAVVEVIRVSFGGVAIGIGLGWLTSLLIARLDDYLIETTLTTVLAFGAYLLAERLHFSGVLAVVGAGIVNGNLGPKGMSPTTRIVLFNFWEYLAFIANSLVFLMIGLDVNIPQIVANIGPIAIAITAVIASRALVVYGLTALTKLRAPALPLPYRHVLFWGGLRGAIGLALVLSLPATLAQRELLKVMAFGVVLFTLLAQGTTLQLLLNKLGLIKRSDNELEYERRHGRLMAARAARERLQRLHRDGMLSMATWEQLETDLNRNVQTHLDAQREILTQHPELHADEIEDARREGLRAQRAMLAQLLRGSLISEHVYEELASEVDAALSGDDANLPSLDAESAEPDKPLQT